MTSTDKKMLGAALASAIVLTGCASMPGPYNGLSSDPMPMTFVHKNPDYGDMTAADYKLIVTHVESCFGDAKEQLASPLETVGTMALANGLSGAAGGSIITKFVPGATVGVYAPYVGTLSAFGGGTAGLQVQSSAVASAISSCANGDLNDPLTRAKGADGLHVYQAQVRSNNRSGKVPSWIKKDPATAASPSGTTGN